MGEASSLCSVKPHVLRYWEQTFPQLTPNKRSGNRRYYQRRELELILEIKHLLYEKRFTLKGANAYLHQKKRPKIEQNQELLKLVDEVIGLLEENC